MADRTGPRLWSAFDASLDIPREERPQLLGGKGAGLVVMAEMGLPVPPGVTITTEACRRHLAGDDDGLDEAIDAALAHLESTTGRRLGDPGAPLLVSVRSGAEVSMPGMMDTVVDLGMTAAVEGALTTQTGDVDFARDTHRRALLSYARVVEGVPDHLATELESLGDPHSILERLAERGQSPPAPAEQVRAAVRAVFESWRSPRATHFRRIEAIPDDLGTAVTIQRMVFGNLGIDSGTGVAFSRNPSTGEPELTGDFLVQAQGDDVVGGGHRTEPVSAIRDRWPGIWDELVAIVHRLEHDFGDMVDVEFTVERGHLWILQTRSGRRSPQAALRIAIDLADDPGFAVDRAEAVRRCTHILDQLPATTDATDWSAAAVIATGLAASPGIGRGVLCLDVDQAADLDAAGTPVVLVRNETSPADVHGMAAAAGLVTTLGGLVSHAAVVARSWGIPAVVGATELVITADGVIGATGPVAIGSEVTVDGTAGRLLLGDAASDDNDDNDTGEEAASPELETLRRWQAELADQ